MLRAVLFDLHGTLVDDEPLRFGIVSDLCRREGFEIEPAVWADRYAGFDDRSALALAFASAGQPLSSDRLRRLDEERKARYEEAADSLSAFPGARQLVAEAARRLPVGVVASSSRREAQAALKATGLFDSLTALVCAEELGRAHPAPAAFDEALRRIDVVLVRMRRSELSPREVLVFEDTESGVAAAKAAGMRVAAVAHTQRPTRLQRADAIAARLLDFDLGRLEKELF